MIKTYDDLESEFLKVPNLGKHYTAKWSIKTDTVAECIAATARGDDQLHTPVKKGKNDCKPKGKKKSGKKEVADDKGSYGTLTQRLLQSLLEDPSTQSTPDSPESSSDQGPSLANGSVLKALNLGNTTQLEKRIKKELEENGLLDLLDDPGSSSGNSPSRRLSSADDGDEILKELTKAQHELKVVAAQNVSSLKHILSAAKLDLARQEIQSNLTEADEEVIDAYKKLMHAKSKKKAMTKKEKDACLKALKQRDALVKQLDSLQTTPASSAFGDS
jgi:transcriptional adapter 3